MKYIERIRYIEVPAPAETAAELPVDLNDETMQLHKEKIVAQMKDAGLDVLLVYGDREHGTNFGYLTGFEPRFEEAVLVLHRNGQAYLLLGNESLRMNQYSRIEADAILVSYFSLPNQPMQTDKTFAELIASAGIKEGMRVGIAGWKMFTSSYEDNQQLFDTPYFIVNAVKELVKDSGSVLNATSLFIHPGTGARTLMNANEIAHYEFGASLASSRILRVLDQLEPGKTEMELADGLAAYGQPNNVQTICATGDRFTNAVVAPRAKKVEVGDKFSVTVGYRGGLTNRSAYVVSSAEELPEDVSDYIDAVAKPYYAASVAWYENVRIGMTGGEMYELIESVLPKSRYGWKLNPGHLTAGEEWMSSPMYPNSEIQLASGMMFQMDIIPSIPGYGGANAEDGIVLADEELRAELSERYPELWGRIQTRREYMIHTLGIQLHPEVLPMSTINGYYRPYLLNKKYAFTVKKQ
ncbi:Xaa-Pro aminopeptidase [Virgibacillus sp. 7505]|uniref:M24 family metallopeptidase n=1 Tax=Virgibacillus sp. 7505 TaxID=2022548 RepID=UPI000BA7465F|nr:aminopeptidase P family protein [Virgibacillus sp. 7505]PAE17346.1 Xaa-Pro aminopeptidase [Virgibacillus sp. 7505]